MKIKINDKEYDVASAIQDARIGDLRVLKRTTRGLIDIDNPDGSTSFFFGVTPKFIIAAFDSSDAPQPLSDEALSVLSEAEIDAYEDRIAEYNADRAGDEKLLLAIQSLIWLSLRRGKEQVTFDECNLASSEFQIISDDEDEAVESDAPKALVSPALEPAVSGSL